jgi:hypothetical protein
VSKYRCALRPRVPPVALAPCRQGSVAHLGTLDFAGKPRQSEIHDAHLAAAIDHDIGGLQVAVQHAFCRGPRPDLRKDGARSPRPYRRAGVRCGAAAAGKRPSSVELEDRGECECGIATVAVAVPPSNPAPQCRQKRLGAGISVWQNGHCIAQSPQGAQEGMTYV